MRRERLWLSWFGWVTVGECAGFAVPSATYAITPSAPAPVQTALLLAAGCAEGYILGLAQARVLRRVVPGTRHWPTATALGAGIAWVCGLVIAELWSDTVLPLPATAGVTVVLAVTGLMSIGTAQWWLLRGRLAKAGWWITGTAAAWVAGLAVFLAVSTPLWHEGQPTGVVVLIGMFAATLMAAAMAAVTGAVLRWLASATTAQPSA